MNDAPAVVCMDSLAWLQTLPADSVHCVITSPPYYQLRDYEVDGQIGLEETPEEFIAKLVAIFREVRRVLRRDGVVWVNMGDTYANDQKWGGGTSGKHAKGVQDTLPRQKKKTGLPPKSLMLIPHKLAIALQGDGWIIRSDAPWLKRSCMPESVEDRATKAHEYIFQLSKSPKYYFDAEAIRQAQSGTAHSRGRGSSPKEQAHGSPVRNNKSWNRSVAAINYTVVPGGRNIRTIDFYNQSLDAQIAALSEELNELKTLRHKQRVLTGDHAIIAFNINPAANHAAHFATYPPALVEPMILSGCPAQVCSKCGAPYVRVIEKEKVTRPPRAAYGGKSGQTVAPDGVARLGASVRTMRAAGGRDHDNPFPKRITVGFKSSCTCEAETIPGLVIDPFAGNGTTGVAAITLNRRFMGCDLKPEYVADANTRLASIVQPRLFT